MSRNMEDNMAALVKVNFGVQFVRFASGQISFGEFLKYAILRPLRIILAISVFLTLLVLVPIEAYCWYIEHTSFTYHLIKGDLESISGNNSRTYKAKLAQSKQPPSPPNSSKESKSDSTEPLAAPEKKIAVASRQVDVISDHYTGCDDPTSGLNDQLLVCNQEVLRVADEDLNRVYKSVVRQLSTEDAAALRKDELLWIKSRDRTCNQEADALNKIVCLTQNTQKRTRILSEMSE